MYKPWPGQTQERQKAGQRKTRRCETLSRRNSAVRRVAITGVQPTQNYGFTAVGMAPSSIDNVKANIARATGLMAAGRRLCINGATMGLQKRPLCHGLCGPEGTNPDSADQVLD